MAARYEVPCRVPRGLASDHFRQRLCCRDYHELEHGFGMAEDHQASRLAWDYSTNVPDRRSEVASPLSSRSVRLRICVFATVRAVRALVVKVYRSMTLSLKAADHHDHRHTGCFEFCACRANDDDASVRGRRSLMQDLLL